MDDEIEVRRSRGWVRVAWFVVPAVAFLGVLGVATLKHERPPGPGDKAPSFSAPLLDRSGSLRLSQLAGKPVLINFWASWCGPCKNEAPMLNAAYRAYGKRVSFLGIDAHDALSDAQKFVADHDVAYPSVRDLDASIYTRYGLTGQPESFLIDADGTIVTHVNGPFLSEDDLFQQLDTLVSRSG